MKRGELVFTKTFKAEFDGAERRGNATFKIKPGNLMILIHMGSCLAENMNKIQANDLLESMGWTFQAEPASASAPVLDWSEYQRISDLPDVDEALRSFSEDATADNAVCVVRAILAAAPVPQQPEQHSDDLAVDRFATAMKARMAEMRAKGKSGWEDCPVERLDSLLRATTDYTQPVDTGNYAMMLYNRNRP